MESTKMGKSTIHEIPCEIMEYILRRPELSLGDLLRFGATCRCYRTIVVDSSELWRNKMAQAWPRLHAMLNRHLAHAKLPKESMDWMAQCRFRAALPARALPLFQQLPREYFDQTSVTIWFHQLLDIMAIADSVPTGAMHLWDYCLELLAGDENENMTLKYYLREVVRELVQQFHWVLIPEWTTLLGEERSVEDFPFELPMCAATQWMKTHQYVDFEVDVVRKLDALASRIMSSFAVRNPEHWAVQAENGLWRWSTDVGGGPRWVFVGPRTCAALRELWTKQGEETAAARRVPTGRENEAAMKFIMEYLLSVDGWTVRLANNGTEGFLDDVLDQRCGWSYLVAVIFCVLGLRFGVICRMRFDVIGVMPVTDVGVVWHDCKFKKSGELDSKLGRGEIVAGGVVLWREFPLGAPGTVVMDTVTEVLTGWRHFAVDTIVSSGQKRILMSCLKSVRSLMGLVQKDPARLYDVVASVFRETQLLEQNRVPFEKAFHPKFFSTWNVQSTIPQLFTDVWLSGKQEKLQDKWYVHRRAYPEGSRWPKETIVYVNEKLVKWAVGMIMHHKRYDYMGVIYRWDPTCMASIEWQNAMRVGQLPLGNEQPFYGVLVSDGSERYVAQENLELVPGPLERIVNPEVPRYFSEYRGLYYLPNDELAHFYPDDGRVRGELLDQFAHSS